ncbi:MAG: cupin domain-containing protein [Cellulosilyticum sp.]|nr:cupin domain-containing protein [Cellulosilyticum sp.]
MDKHLVEFETIEWVNACEGMRYKKFERDGKVLRLMELTDQYKELEWCTHGHIGVILEGEFHVEFENHREHFKEGDIVFISGGVEHKHKAMVPSGKKMKMLSFEL